MTTSSTLHHEREIPDALLQLSNAQDTVNQLGLDPKLRHLVLLRASQINGCGYCVKLHTKEGREDGESEDRMHRVVVWRHVADFSDSEKAALAWTEALTNLHVPVNMDALRAELHQHFSDKEISALTASIAMINLWNRIQASKH